MAAKFLLVFLGGGAGCVLRYAIYLGMIKLNAAQFPFATAIVNVTGSFLIGYFFNVFQNQAQYINLLHPLLLVGFLGGFTTFSAFSLETLFLYKNSQISLALLNIALNFVLCLFAVWLGFQVSK